MVAMPDIALDKVEGDALCLQDTLRGPFDRGENRGGGESFPHRAHAKRVLISGSVSDIAAMKTSSPLRTPGSRATSCAVTRADAAISVCEVRSPQGASSSRAMRTRWWMASRPGLISMRW